MVKDKKKNLEYVTRWHDKNKMPFGVFYLITNSVTGDRFIGFTLQPFKKCLWDYIGKATRGSPHKVCEQIRRYGKTKFWIELLYICEEGDDINHIGKQICLRLKPTLNGKMY